MKSILVAVMFLFLVGCGGLDQEQAYQTPVVRQFEYHGHKYLIFKVNGNFGQTFVHDPDCSCGRK